MGKGEVVGRRHVVLVGCIVHVSSHASAVLCPTYVIGLSDLISRGGPLFVHWLECCVNNLCVCGPCGP